MIPHFINVKILWAFAVRRFVEATAAAVYEGVIEQFSVSSIGCTFLSLKWQWGLSISILTFSWVTLSLWHYNLIEF